MSTFNDIEFSLNFKMRQLFNASPLLLSILINLLSLYNIFLKSFISILSPLVTNMTIY